MRLKVSKFTDCIRRKNKKFFIKVRLMTFSENSIFDRETIHHSRFDDIRLNTQNKTLFLEIFYSMVDEEFLERIDTIFLGQLIDQSIHDMPISRRMSRDEIKKSCNSLIRKIRGIIRRTEIFNNRKCTNVIEERPSMERNSEELGSLFP